MKRSFCFLLAIAFNLNIFAQSPTKSGSEIDSAFVKNVATTVEVDSANSETRSTIAEKPGEAGMEYHLTWHDWLTNIPKDYVKFYGVAMHTSFPVYGAIAASTAALLVTDNGTYTGQHKWYNSSNFIKQTKLAD